ncbi:MAG TPA: sulfurtransferase TusA family protein [Thermoanaerobaculia bacterium]|nr:sulfurtransferase TusA family protein [Thermoanaerobaculia bacterium]
MKPDSAAGVEVDARGLYCPIPVLRLARAFRGRPEGFTARLLATDPAAVEDVEIFCRERGHELLESGREGAVFSFTVRRGGPGRS